jgi:hypothetical protein
MYDTIKFQLLYNQDQALSLHSVVSSMDSVVVKQFKEREGQTMTAKYKGWNFTLTSTFIYGCGSLPKLLYDTNQINFTRAETSLALNRLEQLLGVELSTAKVTRIDFGFNIMLDHPVDTYFKSLCNKSFTKRMPVSNETLYFKGKLLELCFYNKTVQLRDTFQSIHNSYFYQNLVRYEMKLTKRVAKSLGYSMITCADLIDEAFYNRLKHAWYDQYQSIDKLTYVQPDYYGENLTQFKNYLMLEGIEKIGPAEAYNIVDTSFKSNHKIKNRIKRMLKELISSRERGIANDAVAELDEKMFNILQTAA